MDSTGIPTMESVDQGLGQCRADPIFVLGIAERSGTTYLQDLLRLHPDCDVGGVELDEDHLVAHSDLLVQYVTLISRHWKGAVGVDQLEKEKGQLYECLGAGLVNFLNSRLDSRVLLCGKSLRTKAVRRLVTKTPSVTNLHYFFKIFPHAPLLIIIRDGRAVVESSVKTFYRSYEQATREWARQARTILRFCAETQGDNKYVIIKYEDLYNDPERELRKILSFLRLDVGAYNLTAAVNLPLRGSSSLRREAGDVWRKGVAPGIHWAAVQKTAEFNPLTRWSYWSRAKHERFNWIAGNYLSELGYARRSYDGNRFFWATWNFLLDSLPLGEAWWLLNKGIRELRHSSEKSRTVIQLVVKFWGYLRKRRERIS